MCHLAIWFLQNKMYAVCKCLFWIKLLSTVEKSVQLVARSTVIQRLNYHTQPQPAMLWGKLPETVNESRFSLQARVKSIKIQNKCISQVY